MKIVAISYSSFTAINRKVYSALATKSDLKLVIPRSLKFEKNLVDAEATHKDDPALIRLPLIASNPRLHYFKGLWKILRETRPDVIFIENDPISFLCLYCCFYKIFYGAKILCQTNENLSLSMRRFFSSETLKSKMLLFFKRSLCLLVRPFVSVVFTINYDGKRLFEDLKFIKTKWIPLGYDPAYFYKSSAIREKVINECHLTTFTIGYFGRIVPEKGLMLLLEVLSELRDLRWNLLIDNFSRYTTNYIENIREFIKVNKLDDRVVFFDANHDEIGNYMNACDLAVVPSITTSTFKEQYGRVVQETVACGCLTIVSDSGFLPHFFDNPYFVFKENNRGALKSKIESVFRLKDEEKEILVKQAMSYVAANFSITAQCDIIFDTIVDISNNKQSSK